MNTMINDTVTTIGTVQGVNDKQFFLHIDGLDDLIAFDHSSGSAFVDAMHNIKGKCIAVTYTYTMGTCVGMKIEFA